MLKSLRKDLIINILGTVLFVTFINPIFEFTWKVLKNVYAVYIDSLYENASLGQRNWIDFVLLMTVYFVGYNALVALFLMRSFRYQAKEKYEQFKNESDEIIKKDEDPTHYLDNEIKQLKDRRERLRGRIRVTTKILYVLIPIGFLGILVSLFSAYADLQLNSSFNRRLNAIAPYLAVGEEQKLKSSWALMKSRNDFLILNSRMELIAKSHKIELPRNLLQ